MIRAAQIVLGSIGLAGAYLLLMWVLLAFGETYWGPLP